MSTSEQDTNKLPLFSHHTASVPVLRSINVRLDIEHPEHIDHFYPTSKSRDVIAALWGADPTRRAFMIIAPYGTGKSLAATYTAMLIENRVESRASLQKISRRLAEVAPLSTPGVMSRIDAQTRKGMCIVMEGATQNLAQELKRATLDAFRRLGLSHQARTLEKENEVNNIQDATRFLDAAKEKLSHIRKDAQDYERILILWDEFGRHLEYTAQQGNNFAINDLQFLAEYVSRSKDIPIVFALLLHQQMSQYGANLPQQALKEWKKVEGRFSTLHYIDQSRELYQLIARLLKDRKEEVGKKQSILNMPNWADKSRKSKELGLYADFAEEELPSLFEGAWPLDAGALYLLPLVSARVAQNERTIFNFLYQIPSSKVTTAADLYDFFSPLAT